MNWSKVFPLLEQMGEGGTFEWQRKKKGGRWYLCSRPETSKVFRLPGLITIRLQVNKTIWRRAPLPGEDITQVENYERLL